MSFLTVELHEGIATLTFSRPPVNALTTGVLREFAELFASFGTDSSVSVAVLRCEGARAFIGGVDLKDIDADREGRTPADRLDPGAVARAAFRAIQESAVPVIAAVNGKVIGGGVPVVACCDIIVAGETATFGLTEINVGLLGASAYLARMVGPFKAREMFLTGRMAGAPELAATGCIAHLVPDADVDRVAQRVAAELAAKSPLALRLAKESMNRSEYLPVHEGYRLEQEYTARLLTLEDSGEARAAFFEKRPPRWRWR